MSRVFVLCLRELRSQVFAVVGWAVGGGFLLVAGYFFFNLVTQYSIVLNNYSMYAQLTQNPALLDRLSLNEIVIANLFRNLLVVFLFMIPLITMRSFAEERKQGTDELLLTAPVTPGQIVAGKYLALVIVTLSILAASGFFVLILLRYGNPEIGPVWTGLLGLALAAMGLLALGMAVSACTESQIVAAVGSFVLFLLLFVVDWPAESLGGRAAEILKGLSLPERYDSFGKGLVSLPDVVYYLSLAALGLFVARAAVASQRWR